MSEVRVALHSPGDALRQADRRLVAHVPLGTLTAVVVVGACQCHPHGREGGLEGHQGAQEQGQQPEQHGQAVHQHVG